MAAKAWELERNTEQKTTTQVQKRKIFLFLCVPVRYRSLVLPAHLVTGGGRKKTAQSWERTCFPENRLGSARTPLNGVAENSQRGLPKSK